MKQLIEEVRGDMDFDEDKRVCLGCGYWFPKDDMMKGGGDWFCEDGCDENYRCMDAIYTRDEFEEEGIVDEIEV